VDVNADELHPDPIVQFRDWFDQASAVIPLLPNAMALATVSQEGIPSVRMVLLKGFDADGFVFYTNYESRKGRELAANPYASIVLYWRELDRQVSAGGRVEPVSREESQEYFRTRGLGSRLGAWASRQSEVIGSREALEAKFEEAAREFGEDVPLPPYWGGYRLTPDWIEFWTSRADRLHDRIRYTRRGGSWVKERLSP
jgi:pyridoxamine 5'-phosphate oxidase